MATGLSWPAARTVGWPSQPQTAHFRIVSPLIQYTFAASTTIAAAGVLSARVTRPFFGCGQPVPGGEPLEEELLAEEPLDVAPAASLSDERAPHDVHAATISNAAVRGARRSREVRGPRSGMAPCYRTAGARTVGRPCYA